MCVFFPPFKLIYFSQICFRNIKIYKMVHNNKNKIKLELGSCCRGLGASPCFHTNENERSKFYPFSTPRVLVWRNHESEDWQRGRSERIHQSYSFIPDNEWQTSIVWIGHFFAMFVLPSLARFRSVSQSRWFFAVQEIDPHPSPLPWRHSRLPSRRTTI